MAKGNATLFVEIGFENTDGYERLKDAMAKVEALKLDYPWMAESIAEIEDDLVMAATCIGVNKK